jgi:hypothetical protein
MQKFCLSIALLIILSIPVVARADDTLSNDNISNEGWIDITTRFSFTDNFRYNGDLGFRGAFSSNDFTLWYLRPSVSYRIKPWFTIHGGIGVFQSFLGSGKSAVELRPWQGLRFTWPQFKGYKVSHFLRLEQRMLWAKGTATDFNHRLRARYQLGIKTPTYNILFNNGIYVTSSIEFFRNLNESITQNFKNRIRYSVGVGTQVSESWRLELHYLRQDGRALEQDSFSVEENIVRLRLFYQYF